MKVLEIYLHEKSQNGSHIPGDSGQGGKVMERSGRREEFRFSPSIVSMPTSL